MWLNLIIVVMLAILTYFSMTYQPKTVSCVAEDDECEKRQHIFTYKIIVFTVLKVFLVIALIFQILQMSGVPIAPYITGLGFVMAVVGYALKDHISDFATGITFIIAGKLFIGENVRLSISDCGNCPINHGESIRISSLGPFSLEGVTDTKRVVVRYNSILAIERL